MKERVFVVSDLHGVKSVYDGITNYLDEVALCNPEEEVKLIINGDLIDRGDHSIEMIQDIIDRQNNQKGYFSIDVLAGNHEMMMYEALQMDYNSYYARRYLGWFLTLNGGGKTAYQFDKLSKKEQDTIERFLDKLELQKIINKEILDTKGVIITHAHASGILKFMQEEFHITPILEDIKEDMKEYHKYYDRISNKYSEYLHTVWDRKSDNETMGLKNYITIIGHTPELSPDGYDYDKESKVLNIDGNCASYAFNYVNNVTVPLLELDFQNKEIIIHRFNGNGEQLETHVLTKNGIEKSYDNKVKRIIKE